MELPKYNLLGNGFGQLQSERGARTSEPQQISAKFKDEAEAAFDDDFPILICKNGHHYPIQYNQCIFCQQLGKGKSGKTTKIPKNPNIIMNPKILKSDQKSKHNEIIVQSSESNKNNVKELASNPFFDFAAPEESKGEELVQTQQETSSNAKVPNNLDSAKCLFNEVLKLKDSKQSTIIEELKLQENQETFSEPQQVQIKRETKLRPIAHKLTNMNVSEEFFDECINGHVYPTHANGKCNFCKPNYGKMLRNVLYGVKMRLLDSISSYLQSVKGFPPRNDQNDEEKVENIPVIGITMENEKEIEESINSTEVDEAANIEIEEAGNSEIDDDFPVLECDVGHLYPIQYQKCIFCNKSTETSRRPKYNNYNGNKYFESNVHEFTNKTPENHGNEVVKIPPLMELKLEGIEECDDDELTNYCKNSHVFYSRLHQK